VSAVANETTPGVSSVIIFDDFFPDERLDATIEPTKA
jgi:hypothetical protein